MAVIGYWDNTEKTIYCLQANDYWQWQDFATAVEKAYSEIQFMKHNVDMIFFFGSHLPPGDAMNKLMMAGANQPVNLKRSVIVNESGGFLERLIRKTAKSKNWDGPAFVNTLDEARELLQ